MTIVATLDQRSRGEVVVEPPPEPVNFTWDDVLYQCSQSRVISNRFGQIRNTASPLISVARNHTLGGGDTSLDIENKPPYLNFSIQNTFGTGGYVFITDPTNLLQLGVGGEFTLEGWIYIQDSSEAQCLFGDWAANDKGWFFGIGGNTSDHFNAYNKPIFVISPDGTIQDTTLQGETALTVDTWVHIAVDRDAGNYIRLYANGVMVAKRNLATWHTTLTYVGMRAFTNKNFHGGGSYAEMRIVKKAIYASDEGFVLPTTHLIDGVVGGGDPHWNNVTFLWRAGDDNNNFGGLRPMSLSRFCGRVGNNNYNWNETSKYGMGSVLPSGQFTWHYTDDFDMVGLTQFTAEAWIYLTNYAARRGIINFYSTTSGRRQWALTNNNGKLELLAAAEPGTAATILEASTVDTPLNEWVHVAVTRDAIGVFHVYQNGVRLFTNNIMQNQPLNDAVAKGLNIATIGAYSQQGANLLLGRISEVRVTKGTNRYGGQTFIPPTHEFRAYEYFAPTVTVSDVNYDPGETMPDDGNIVDIENESDDAGFVLPDTNTLEDGYTVVVRRLSTSTMRFWWHGDWVYLEGGQSFVLKWSGGIWYINGMSLIREWEPDKFVMAVFFRSYGNAVYECIQSHTTAIGLEPPTEPTLWQELV